MFLSTSKNGFDELYVFHWTATYYQKKRFFWFRQNFDQNFDFWPKLRFLTKIASFDQNFDFWPKLRVLTKIASFDQNCEFWPKLRVLTKYLDLIKFRFLLQFWIFIKNIVTKISKTKSPEKSISYYTIRFLIKISIFEPNLGSGKTVFFISEYERMANCSVSIEPQLIIKVKRVFGKCNKNISHFLKNPFSWIINIKYFVWIWHFWNGARWELFTLVLLRDCERGLKILIFILWVIAINIFITKNNFICNWKYII